MTSLNHILVDLFRAHRVECKLDGESVRFSIPPMQADLAIVKETTRPGMFNLQMDMRLQYSPGREVIESFAGIGPNRDAAITDALANFSAGSFHVILAAFFNIPDDEQVLREEWIIGGHRTRVTLGNFAMRGSTDAGKELGDCFKQIEAKIKTAALQQGTHWIRIYYAQMHHKPTIFEVLLDNGAWLEMGRELSGIPWPSRDEFYSARLFMVAEVLEGGIAAPDAAVQKLAEIIAASPAFDEDAIYAAMAHAGVPDSLADRAYKFTQTAFARTILEGMVKLDPTYIGFNSAGEVIESGNLTDDACFNAAMRLARQYIGYPRCRQFTLASAEVNTVNAALKGGSKADDLVLSPAAFFLQPPTDAGMKKVTEFLQAQLKARHKPIQSPKAPTAPKRPWWKPFK